MLVQLSKASLVIYLVHTYVVTALKRVAISVGIGNPVIAILSVMTITLCVTYSIYLLSPKNKILSYLFKPVTFIEKYNKY